MRKIVAALAGATLVSGFLFAGGAMAANASSEGTKASGESSTRCTWVRQYSVTEYGHLVDRNGNRVGDVFAGDTLNARELNIGGRHWGYVAQSGKYGGVLTSKLQYLGDACV